MDERDERDFNSEIRALIDEYTGGDEPYNAATLSSKLCAELRRDDPTLLAGWLDRQAESLMRTTISKIDASDRGHARAVSGRRSFAAAFSDHDSGDPEAMTRWLDTRFTVGEEHSRKPLWSMTKVDCTIAADTYTDRARRNELQAAFLRAVAKRVRSSQTVGDVFSERQLANLWARLNGEEPAASAAA